MILHRGSGPHCVYPASVGGRVSCFHFLPVANAAAVSVAACIPVWVPALHSLRSVSRGGTAGPYGNSMFNFSRKRQTVFDSGCTFCVSSSNAGGFGFSPYSPTVVIFCSFLKVVVILMGVNLFLFLITEVS